MNCLLANKKMEEYIMDIRKITSEYVDMCLREYLVNNRTVGWVRKITSMSGRIQDDAYDITDVISHCAMSLDIDSWLVNPSISPAVESEDVKALKNLINHTMWFKASDFIKKINRAWSRRNTYNESQLSTDDNDYDIADASVCYDDDEYDDYMSTPLYQQVIAPILDTEPIRKSTRDNFEKWLFTRADDLDRPKYDIENELGVNHTTIDTVVGKIKTNKLCNNILRNYGFLDGDELIRQNDWSLEMMERKYGTTTGINPDWAAQFGGKVVKEGQATWTKITYTNK